MRGRREYIDSDIRGLLADAEELAEYVLEEFEELSISEQDIWLYGFPNEMVKVKRLERTYRAGEMNKEQEERYLDLKAKLRELAPAIERIMEIRVPREILEV